MFCRFVYKLTLLMLTDFHCVFTTILLLINAGVINVFPKPQYIYFNCISVEANSTDTDKNINLQPHAVS